MNDWTPEWLAVYQRRRVQQIGNVELVTINGGAVQAASPPRETAAALAGPPPINGPVVATQGSRESEIRTLGSAHPSTSGSQAASPSQVNLGAKAGTEGAVIRKLPNPAGSERGTASRPLTKSKFRNVKTDGYASKREAKRAETLKLMEKAGLIRNLREQVSFPIVVNGIRICAYKCDYAYDLLDNGAWLPIVEDVKSEYTAKLPVYRLKKKLMKACHGIEITEV